MTHNKNETVEIIKLNTQDQEVWRYTGQILSRDNNSLLVEAFFNIEDKPFHGITIRRNDRSIERFYSDRWYNIFEIHDRDDDRLKAWYCNVTKPAVFCQEKIAYVDLALDILVYPDNTYLILDKDEFESLALDTATREKALGALEKLQQIVENKELRYTLK